MALLKKDSLLTQLLIMLGISVLLVLIMIFGLDLYTRHGQTVVVPNLQGKTLAQAEELLRAADLDYEINDSTYNSAAQPGTIREVSPQAGSRVKAGRLVFLSINGFHQRKQTVPNYKDQSARQILSLMTGLGFTNIEQKTIPGGYVGSVVGLQTVDGRPVLAGTQVAIDTHLILLVAGQKIDTLGLNRYIEEESAEVDSTATTDAGSNDDWW